MSVPMGASARDVTTDVLDSALWSTMNWPGFSTSDFAKRIPGDAGYLTERGPEDVVVFGLPGLAIVVKDPSTGNIDGKYRIIVTKKKDPEPLCEQVRADLIGVYGEPHKHVHNAKTDPLMVMTSRTAGIVIGASTEIDEVVEWIVGKSRIRQYCRGLQTSSVSKSTPPSYINQRMTLAFGDRMQGRALAGSSVKEGGEGDAKTQHRGADKASTFLEEHDDAPGGDN
ncbi:MAG: hypothetical protein AAF458_23760 [Pseudomonadota bacterium]